MQVEAARSRYELKARAVTALEERREELTTETKVNADALPGLEKKKKVGNMCNIVEFDCCFCFGFVCLAALFLLHAYIHIYMYIFCIDVCVYIYFFSGYAKYIVHR